MKLILIRHGETDWNKGHRFQGQIDVPLNDYGRYLAEVTRDAMPRVPYLRVYCSPLGRAVETAHILLRGRPEEEDIRIDQRLIEFGFGDFEGTDIEMVGRTPTHPLYNMLHHPERYVATAGAESFEHLLARCRAFLDDEIIPLERRLASGALSADGVADETDSMKLQSDADCPTGEEMAASAVPSTPLNLQAGGDASAEALRRLSTDQASVLVVAHGALIRAIVCAAGFKEVKDFWGCRYFNCCVTTLDVTDGRVTLESEAVTYYDPQGAFGGWQNPTR